MTPRDQLLLMGVISGFIIVPLLASASRTMVNAVLLLLLMGAILMNSDRWLPIMTSITGAFATRERTPVSNRQQPK